ncbi:hypothetical protein RCOM_1188890 [Ricinus communis]|uniref:Uncharacterized protein n=2 Tax=Ricinus communis TaxID=3988 RepID=B9RRE8_RICCO|nr:hypothetical protein RCOM_1188890 [Ricinus communis]
MGAFSSGFAAKAFAQAPAPNEFGQPAQMGAGQQALGSVLRSSGRSRQFGAGLIGGFASASSMDGFSRATTGGGFAVVASGGGFPSLASSSDGLGRFLMWLQVAGDLVAWLQVAEVYRSWWCWICYYFFGQKWWWICCGR